MSQRTQVEDARIEIGAYAVGKECTWHGSAETLVRGACPQCGCAVTVLTYDEWIAQVRAAEKANPGYGVMFAWAIGRCFPDLDTLENAYRQAMEE